ncbi:MAG: ABC transporter permease [Bacteroidota bacterium]
MKLWLRTITRYRLYTFVNLAGLSLGICAVVAIFLYVIDELSYDKFQTNGDRIYRINVTNHFSTESRWPTTAAAIGSAIKNDLTDAEKISRIYTRQASVELTNPESSTTKFRENNAWFADPEVFEMFTFKFIAGDAKSALSEPNKIVLARSVAERYFGSVDKAVGSDVMFEGRTPMIVSAVFENLPPQSYLQATLIAHFENYYTLESDQTQQYLREDWIYNPVETFVMLKPGVDPKTFESELMALRDKYGDERVRKASVYNLQPFTKIHLYSDFFSETPQIQGVYILASIGFVILIIACVNFINLANVHSLRRAREIGIRKVLGAQKKGLILQFLAESGALVLIAFFIGITALYILLPFVNTLSGKQFSITDLVAWKVMSGIALLFIGTSFLSGTYPAFYITRFNPIIVLKGLSGNRTSEGYTMRKVLMTLQFTISIVLVVLSIIFWQQMQYVSDKPLGFQTTNIITVPLFSDNPNSLFGGGVDGDMRARMNAFENELVKKTGVEGVTASALLPGTGFSANALVWTDKITQEDNVLLSAMSIDYDFIKTYKMEIVAGRDFSKETGTDHLTAFIINEQASKKLGWNNPADAIGQNFGCLGKRYGTIVGVVKDFHFEGLQAELRPMVLEVAAGKFNIFSISLSEGARLNEMIAFVRGEWNKAFPEKVFEYNFLDQRLAQNYGRESRMVNMMQCFAALAIVISALGLFGLAAYINYQRSKEISIRKILGANISQVFYVLSQEFVKMSLIAFVIAIPFAWYLASRWMDSFSYKITIGAFSFLVGGMIALATVLITISYETIKSAKTNPVETLRE